MIVVSKLDKPRHLKQIVHKDSRGSLTEIFLKKKIKFNFCKCITVTSKINVIRGLHFQKKFSQNKEGDYIGLADVGAYGMSLSSNYNARPTIAEIMVSGSKHKIIRKRQSLENLVNN